jgi:hypothetical protein
MADPRQPGAQPYYDGAPPIQPAPRNMRRRRMIAISVLLIIVVGVAIAALTAHGSSPDSAKVNDCVTEPANNSIKVVGCGDGSAAFRVAGKVEHKTQVDASLNSGAICKPFPDATKVYWRGVVGKPGYILCLSPLKK